MSQWGKRRGAVIVALAATVLAGACGGDNKVGDESILNFEEQVNEGLGATTTTTAAPAATRSTAAGGAGGTATTAPAGGTKATATTATTAQQATATTQAVATTTTQAPEQVVEILIQSDSADKPMEPDYARAYVGTKVRWVNKDTVARSVAATTGEFKSPAIPPGGTFEYKATKVGIFDYGDGTRPYVNAILEILEAP